MAHGARRIAITLACGAVLGVAAVAAVDAVDELAGAQANKISVTAARLQVNQRISQAAVRRSNESLNLLRPIRPAASIDRNPTNPFNAVAKGTGWPTAAIAEQAITSSKIGEGSVTTVKLGDDAVTNSKLANPNYRAVIRATGALNRGNATSSLRTDTGRYRVEFPEDVAACTFVAQQGDGDTAVDDDDKGFAAAGLVSGKVNAVQVATRNLDGTLTNRDFHLTVTC